MQHVPGSDMLLLDGGCEFHGYCSDVTRTWPVGGKYSGAQAAVYEVVLDAHRCERIFSGSQAWLCCVYASGAGRTQVRVGECPVHTRL